MPRSGGAAGRRRGHEGEGWQNGPGEDSGRRARGQSRPPSGRGPRRSREARRGARIVRPRGQHQDPRLPQGQGPAEGARGAARPRSHLQRGRRVPHQRLVLERRRRCERQARYPARAQLRPAELGGRAVQLHRRVRRPGPAGGRRVGRARGARPGAGRPRGAGRARARGPTRFGRRARPGRGPPGEGRRRHDRRPRRRVRRGPARLRGAARRGPACRGHRTRSPRDEPGRHEDDRVHGHRGAREAGRGDPEGAQGAGVAAARRRAGARSERVRDARGAPRGDRGAPARGDPGRARRRLSRRRDRQARRGVERRRRPTRSSRRAPPNCSPRCSVHSSSEASMRRRISV